jgi:cell shape-determining protein MreD
LGTSPKQLQRFLMKQFLPANILITVICVVAVAVLQYFLQQYLQTQNMNVSPWISYYTIIADVLILFVLWIVNRSTINKYIRETEKKF